MTRCSAAQSVEQKDWENLNYFESCLPIEEIARRGRDTLRFGPMKPVGLKDPRTGRIPYAACNCGRKICAPIPTIWSAFKIT
jgi:folate-dependent tRNA-U54 methylase TrmFO/GidA